MCVCVCMCACVRACVYVWREGGCVDSVKVTKFNICQMCKQKSIKFYKYNLIYMTDSHLYFTGTGCPGTRLKILPLLFKYSNVTKINKK